ncbi:hypothetical protein BOTBODRAFT_310766 [Botryobasidium botryosum FD-172 SS1]|uniref:Uncharacterized protein n=1 Tax=Botryobasidium botryosum (strain FD-172 SS1) TaxID=930990 RepID=A0A067N9S2_BOTB1|nr:hypothetical protein BOTBODRAFT_310766 [Botryobasidium botryosum FD-172 SS1]
MTDYLDAKAQLEYEHARQRAFKPSDRRKSKAKPRHKGGRFVRKYAPLGDVDVDSHDTASVVHSAMDATVFRRDQREVSLMDLIRPTGKKQRDSFEMVPRPNRRVIALDDEESSDEEWERIDSRIWRGGPTRPTYAGVASGKRRAKEGR